MITVSEQGHLLDSRPASSLGNMARYRAPSWYFLHDLTPQSVIMPKLHTNMRGITRLKPNPSTLINTDASSLLHLIPANPRLFQLSSLLLLALALDFLRDELLIALQ